MQKQESITFADDYINFDGYRYPPASVYPSGRLHATEVVEVLPMAAPPEVRTVKKDILFIPASRKEELRNWCARHCIPLVHKVDVWSLILEPYLDTEYSKADDLRTLEGLLKCGISAAEVDSIRRRVGKMMLAYNFDSMLWEWVHLGLSDVLDAYMGILTGPWHKLPPEEYAYFYWYAVDLAHKGHFLYSA